MRMETDTADALGTVFFFGWGGVNIHTADHLKAFHCIFHDSFTAVLQLAVVATLLNISEKNISYIK